MNKTTEVFLQLVRLGLGTKKNHYFIDSVNWTEIAALAEKQGLTAIVLDGIESLPDNKRPPQVMLLNLIGEVLQSYEQRYEIYKKTISEMAAF